MTGAKRSYLRYCGVAVVAGVSLARLASRERPESPQTAHDRMVAEDIVRTWGNDSFAYFALRRDRNWFFSPTKRAFLAYTNVGRLAYVSGDPIGDPTEFRQLIDDFRAVAHRRGQHLIFMATSQAAQPLYADMGLKSIYIGDEAIVDPSTFSLEGRDIRKVRQSVNRLRKVGYTVSILAPGEIDEKTQAQMRELSNEWRRGTPERGFTMNMDELFSYPDTAVAIARNADGNVGGFVQVVPTPATSGYSLAATRRRLDAPNGLTEFLLVELLDWAKQRGSHEASLNFTSLGRYHRQDHGPVHWALTKAERIVPMQRLQKFNDKFSPEWRPRYVCVERYMDLPVGALACARLEGFLRSPLRPAGPDLTAA